LKKMRMGASLQAWIDARRRHRLSHAQVQMARELGMTPKKLGGLDNHRQERWKLPLPSFIEELYARRFGHSRLEPVLSIEEYAQRQGAKKAAKREAKLRRRETAAAVSEEVTELALGRPRPQDVEDPPDGDRT
jgi:hypothetical protein